VAVSPRGGPSEKHTHDFQFDHRRLHRRDHPFILSLGGLSNPETSRRGNLYGIVGMTIAVLATVLGPRVAAAGIPWIVAPWWWAGPSASMPRAPCR
jgi:hypothetical protein